MNALLPRWIDVFVDVDWTVGFLTKLTLLLTVVWLLHAALTKANPRWRVLVWRVGAVSALLLLVLSLAGPAISLAILPPMTEGPSVPAGAMSRPSADPLAVVRGVVPDDAPALELAPSLRPMASQLESGEVGDFAAGHPTAVGAETQSGVTASADLATTDTRRWIMAMSFWTVWGLGVLAGAMQEAVVVVRLRRMRRRAIPADASLVTQAATIAARMNWRKPFDVLITADFGSPFVLGAWRPAIVLPHGHRNLARGDDLVAVLAHEIQHLKNADLVWNTLLRGMANALWFHPLVWSARNAHAAACDAACDATAAAYTGDVAAYCRTLARMALRAAERLPVAGLAMARGSSTLHRIESLHRRLYTSRLPRSGALSAMLVGLVGAGLLGTTSLSRADGGARLKPPSAVTTHSETPAADKSPPPASDNQATERPAALPQKIEIPPAQPTQGAISGTVVDPAGKPIAGARVALEKLQFDDATLTGSMTRLAESRTDALGRFRLGPLAAVNRPKPRFELTVDAAGFAPLAVGLEGFSIFPGADCDLGNLQVDPPCIVTGQVIDADGRPRAGATVRCEVKRPGNFVIPPVNRARSVLTGEDGRFRTPPLSVGQLVLTVQAPQRQPVVRRLPIGPPGEVALAEPVRLEHDVPVFGSVVDERGTPVAGVVVRDIDDRRDVTDEKGRFTIRGFGPSARVRLMFAKQGYRLAGQDIAITPDGTKEEPVVTLQPSIWIAGRAVDAESNKPVKLDKIVLCTFRRQPDGTIQLGLCAPSKFEQPEPGTFRVPYSRPDEYHLAFSAAGYHDAEAFTPPIKELRRVEGLQVKLKKKTAGSQPVVQKQTFHGTVTRDGEPVTSGWVGLWLVPRSTGVHLLRGRVVVAPPPVVASAPIRDGAYELDVPVERGDWYLVAEEPGKAVMRVGPFAIAANERKQVDIACDEGGGIRGQVRDVPAEWKGKLWVIAFGKTSVRAEARVAADGSFAFENLPPGEYGLKVGHNAYRDREAPQKFAREDLRKQLADPWKRAVGVNVESGRITEGVELEPPP